MHSLRILLLSQWYDPEPNFKSGALGRALVARGHIVTAITGFPNYPQGRVYPGYRQRLWQWEKMDGVRVLRLPLYPDHSRSAARRSLNYLSFAASTSLLGPALCGPADVMWVYHPPLTVGIPAWWIGLLRRVPFVYEIQDMWPETLPVSGMVTNERVLGWLGHFADFVYKQAAAITVISPGFKRNLVQKGVPAERIHVVPNWADEEIYRPVLPDPVLAEEYEMAGRFNIIYAGNMGLAQALDTVVEAATLLQDLPAVQFIMIGDGLDRPELERQVQTRQLTNVRFLPRQPAERMPHFYALADALLVHLKRDPLFEITIPSKTLAYMACGRPILCAVAGDAADVVRSAGAGVTCSPQHPPALAQAVRKLYSMSKTELEALGQAGRGAFRANYTRQVLIDRYEALLADVAERWKARQDSGLHT